MEDLNSARRESQSEPQLKPHTLLLRAPSPNTATHRFPARDNHASPKSLLSGYVEPFFPSPHPTHRPLDGVIPTEGKMLHVIKW